MDLLKEEDEVNRLLNHGDEELLEWLKARNTVQARKAKAKP